MDQEPLYGQNIDQALRSLQSGHSGLASQEAAERLKIYGKNELAPKTTPLWKRILEPFAGVFVGILAIAVVISLFAGEVLDAIVIGVILVANALIYYVQQFSAGRVLKALRGQDVDKVKVKRGGKIIEIESALVVPGDIVFLREGEMVPADGRLIDHELLHINESVLTGESLPVSKNIEPINGQVQIYDQKNMLFKGTVVHSGSAVVAVSATGNSTELGNISTLASENQFGRSPIEKKIDRLTKQLVLVFAAIAVLVFALALYRGIEVSEALRYTLSLVVAVVPEGLPVSIAVVLLLAAKRLARHKVLVKKISSIQTMGAITLIAADKTGTLTVNQLSVAETAHVGQANDFHTYAAASLNGEVGLRADPLDEVIEESFDKYLPKDWRKVQDIPFQQNLRASAAIWQGGQKYILIVKGAPEALLEHAKNKNLTDDLHKKLSLYASRGYRTIAVGHAEFSKKPTELTAHTFHELNIDGLIALADKIRPNIKQTVMQARAAGVRVVMLTGDHKETAKEIGRQAGLVEKNDQVSSGDVIVNGSEIDRENALSKVTVFGRVLPEHKFAFLKAVKSREITAMTGDGVNDVPAIVEADAGLAMGNGTDAAKQASDMILLDSNLQTIVTAISLGRSVVANIRKMLMYLLTTSVGSAIPMVLALLMGLPLPVVAVQVLWINLVTGGFTVIPLGLAAPEEQQMKRPPDNPKAPILGPVMLTRIAWVGGVAAISSLILFMFALEKGDDYARTVMFTALVVSQLANALNANFDHASWIKNVSKPNWLLWLGLFLAGGLQALALFGPIQDVFHVVAISSTDLMLAILVPLISVLLAGDLHKLVTRGKRHN